MNQFSELTLPAVVHENLVRNCFTKPTPVQAQAIPVALTGVDIVATAQTGTGKTLAFLLPIYESLLKNVPAETDRRNSDTIRALILSPTRELAIQIADTFSKLARNTQLRAAVVVGGLSEHTQINSIRRGAQVIIATPGRLEDFLDRQLVKLSSVRTLVLDEADRMLDMGFLPAIENILSTLPASRQSLFFSATMERGVERLIVRHSNNPVRIAVGSSIAKTPEVIDLNCFEVENDSKLSLLRHLLKDETGSFLVFARTKHGTDRLARKLSTGGLKAVAMHGDRTQNQRNQALAGFRDGRYRILVATDVAARGIHVDGVAHVVNYDLPQAPQDFIHRVGRTGRAGQKGAAWTFSLRSERNEIRRIERECKVLMTRRPLSAEVVSERDEIVAEQPAFTRFERPSSAHTANNRFSRPGAKRAFKPKGKLSSSRKQSYAHA